MPKHDAQPTDFDWSLTSFEGARRQQLRRRAQLPLENILLATEEMQDIARLFAPTSGRDGESVGENQGFE